MNVCANQTPGQLLGMHHHCQFGLSVGFVPIIALVKVDVFPIDQAKVVRSRCHIDNPEIGMNLQGYF